MCLLYMKPLGIRPASTPAGRQAGHGGMAGALPVCLAGRAGVTYYCVLSSTSIPPVHSSRGINDTRPPLLFRSQQHGDRTVLALHSLAVLTIHT